MFLGVDWKLSLNVPETKSNVVKSSQENIIKLN